MSFLTRFSSRIITPLASGYKELLDRVPQESEAGWDSMRDTWLCRYDAGANDPLLILAHFTELDRASQVTAKNMWIVSRAPKLLATGLIKVDVVSMGLLSTRGYKVTYDAAAASQSGTSVLAPNPPDVGGESVYAKVATREGSVTATFEYVAVASVAPTHVDFLTALTGRAKAPPTGWAPTVPDSVWDFLTIYTYNWPNGWCFDGASMENLPGLATVFLIKEKYAYQQAKTPG